MARLWRTEAGDLVEDGHPDAVVLAYGDDDTPGDGEKVRAKKQAPAADKKAKAPRNKGA